MLSHVTTLTDLSTFKCNFHNRTTTHTTVQMGDKFAARFWVKDRSVLLATMSQSDSVGRSSSSIALHEISLGTWIAMKTFLIKCLHASICVPIRDWQDWDPSMPDQKWSWAITSIMSHYIQLLLLLWDFPRMACLLEQEGSVSYLGMWNKWRGRENYSNKTRACGKGRFEELSDAEEQNFSQEGKWHLQGLRQ